MIGVNCDRDIQNAHNAVKKHELNWRSFRDETMENGSIATAWGVTGWPTVFILDEDGMVRWRGNGHGYEDTIVTLLSEMGHDIDRETLPKRKD